MSEATLTLSDPEVAFQLFGPRDQNLRLLRGQFNVSIVHRNGQLRIQGEETQVRKATEVMERLRDHALRTGRVGTEEVLMAIGRLRDGTGDQSQSHLQNDSTHVSFAENDVAAASQSPDANPLDLADRSSDFSERNGTRSRKISQEEFHGVSLGSNQNQIKPRTEGQAKYIRAIQKNSMTFCIGPAGCGKTFLAVAAAVEALKSRRVRKIVLVRPAVEAGESLGFLPGDLQAKLNPYLRPLLDAIGEMVDYDQAKYLMEQETIEVIPLAYMRGRTLNQAFIILDEAQNTTVGQMKMFLTRMGEGSKVVVSGDISQVDLPSGVTSGLRDAAQRLQGIEDLSFIRLGQSDIVRHELVNRIVSAYDSSKIPPGITFSSGDD